MAYNRLVLSPLTHDPAGLTITGTIRLTSTVNPTMQAITGRLSVNASQGVLEIEVGQLDFYRRIQLSGPQIAAVMGTIGDAQNAVESGLVAMGVVAGVQTTGS